MDQKTFSERALALALEAGCEAAETYFAEQDGFSVNVNNGTLEQYEVSRKGGLSLRVCVAGRNGYAYTEALEAPETLVARAVDNAKCIEITDEHPMQGACVYEEVEAEPQPLLECSEADKIALALSLEQGVKAADARIVRTIYCEVGTVRTRVAIRNTRGLCAEHASEMGFAYVLPLLSDGEDVETGFGFRTGAQALDAADCAREAAADAAGKVGAAPVPSGAYRVILQNLAMADLLEAFSDMFSAEECQKGCSLLAGREGQTIGSACVTIADDPFAPILPAPFDDEGTPSQLKLVVENGVLKTLLHNLQTAKKAGCASTGNARRASAASPVSVGPTVMRVEPGQTSFDALLCALGDGLVITELEGLHAGVNAVSGDFSLKATGYLVKDGKREKPVSSITIAGNFLDLLAGVELAGSDLRYGLPQNGCFAAPSLLIGKLAVAGT